MPVSCFLVIALTAGAAPGEDQHAPGKPPHMVVILSDDQGWHDVGYHGSEIRTPSLDRLAASGTRLNQFYVQPLCSPTRAALMTGRYPIRLGLQVMVVRPWADYGLPLEERTLAQALKEAGYQTAIVGKWHLGHCRPEYLPTRRGFDHQYGHYNGAIDYFTHMRDGGLDWHRDDKALREEGYSTDLIAREAVRVIESHDLARPLFLYVPFNAPHAPLQAPPRHMSTYADVKERDRRTYAAMVTCMDEAVGRIVAALDRRGIRENTLLFFSSDNGGAAYRGGGADNRPLRGAKGSLYEGGVRVPAFVVWPRKLKGEVIVDQPLHIVDLYPTLIRLAGGSLRQSMPLDGLDAWPTIAEGKPSPHEEILHNIEPRGAAIRRGDWKLLRLSPENGKPPAVELYDIRNDISETTNLADRRSDKVRELSARLEDYARQAVPAKGNYANRAPAGFKRPQVWGE
jgi:arylsulfatase A-like enzyme